MSKPTEQEVQDRVQRTVTSIVAAWAGGIGPHLIRGGLGHRSESSAQPLESLEIKIYGEKMVARSIVAPLPPNAQKRIDYEVAQFNEFLKLV